MSNDLVRGSDITQSMMQIKSLSERLTSVSNELNKWFLKIEGKTNHTNEGFVVELTITKPDGSGFIELLTPEDIKFYNEDPDALIYELTTKIIETFYRKQIRDVICNTVTRGLRNAAMMEARS